MRPYELHAALRAYDPDHGINDYLHGRIERLADDLGCLDEIQERLETVTSTLILFEIEEELEARMNE